MLADYFNLAGAYTFSEVTANFKWLAKSQMVNGMKS